MTYDPNNPFCDRPGCINLRVKKSWFCRRCNTDMKRSYRQRDPLRKQKDAVRGTVNRFIASGLIRRWPCEVCGSVPADAHHEDYAKALEIRWLCEEHHHLVTIGDFYLLPPVPPTAKDVMENLRRTRCG